MNQTANNLFKYLHAIQHVIKINIPNKGVYIVSSRQAFKGVFVEMRSNLNLSQDKSSKQAGISRSAITGIESETMNFTIDIFLKGIYGLNCFLTIEPIEQQQNTQTNANEMKNSKVILRAKDINKFSGQSKCVRLTLLH